MKKEMLGGGRLGAGNKMEFHTKEFGRSTHNLNEIFRSTMSAGTLVPCLVLPVLPGDTIDIDVQVNIRTLPTIGPLFGSYKSQTDFYLVPMRLYNRDLQMNKLELGRNIEKVQFPIMNIYANNIGVGLNNEWTKETPWGGKEINNCQIEPSTILSYLGIKGLGYKKEANVNVVQRTFNAVPWLMYWDIYKQYYANKMEDDAYYIHNSMLKQNELIQRALVITNEEQTIITTIGVEQTINDNNSDVYVILEFEDYEKYALFDEEQFNIRINYLEGGISQRVMNFRGSSDMTKPIQRNDSQLRIFYSINIGTVVPLLPSIEITLDSLLSYNYNIPNLDTFPLKNIDIMRERIMTQEGDSPLVLQSGDIKPYTSIFDGIFAPGGSVYEITALQCKQEGLAIKTYQSDINNNWLNTDWIDGGNGVNAVTAIEIGADGKFTLDEFNIKKKVYDMLNHIVASGGSYDDWQDTIWGVQRMKQISSPVYEGGLSKELVFDEVINNSASDTAYGAQPLGTLAGRGVMSGKHKGGKMVIKATEPSYIIGITSLTPRIDYSSGNEWYTGLKNMSELHNPYLDAIGYQDLITDTLAFWDTRLDSSFPTPIFKSAGKQPSWINYQTSKNKVYGNFALQNDSMFMVLNRRYEVEQTDLGGGETGWEIGDVTTYIDPQKYNHIFADTSSDAQNFWVQIGMDITARRVMSANQIPNL